MKIVKKIAKWILIVFIGLAAIYFIVATTQVKNARKIQTIKKERIVNAPVAKVWQIISQVENYHQVTTPALHDVKVTGSGTDMKRTCYTNQGTQWSETCTAWEDQSHFTFLVDTKAEDYPLPLTYVQGTWGVEPVTENSTKIYIEFEYKVKNPWLSWMFINGANQQLTSGFEYTFDNWQKQAENPDKIIILISKNDLTNLAKKIIGNATSSREKTKRIIDWSNNYLAWNESDYMERSVIEIINQKGGTCGEQSITVRTLLDIVGVKNRECAEINIQPVSIQREIDSKELMKKYGPAMSVFGLQYNDHRWVEFYDEKLEQWVPTDPTLKLFGINEWIKARIGFNDRPVHEVINSKDMIAPITIVAIEKGNKIVDNRSSYYLIEKFDEVYDNKLQELPSWTNWTIKIREISPKCEAAFKGRLDLHEYNTEIQSILEIYNKLKDEFNSSE